MTTVSMIEPKKKVGAPGLEPEMAESKPAVLPITPCPSKNFLDRFYVEIPIYARAPQHLIQRIGGALFSQPGLLLTQWPL